MTTLLVLAGFLGICFLLVWHWQKLSKKDAENAKKKEAEKLDRLLSLDYDENSYS